MKLTGFWIVAAGMTLLAGCSSFNRDYERALNASAGPAGVEGAWHGTWKSDAGHGGDDLRCIVTSNGANAYRAWFRAKYWGVFEFEQDIPLSVTSTNPVRATGEADLGYFKGGVYSYEATITPTEFHSTYRSKYDHGVFMLSRPGK